MNTLVDLIKSAIALIFAHSETITALTKKVQDQSVEIADLKAADVRTAGTTQQLQEAKDAAEAHDVAATAHAAELQATLNALDEQKAALAEAITNHPDVPLDVAPDLTVTPSAPPVDDAAPVAQVNQGSNTDDLSKSAAPPADLSDGRQETPAPKVLPETAAPSPEAPISAPVQDAAPAAAAEGDKSA